MTPPLKILLVDDSADEVALIEGLLEESSLPAWSLVHKDRLHLALLALASDSFDVVILDDSLPDGTGVAALRQLRRANKDIPVLVLVGADQPALDSGEGEAISRDELDPQRLAMALRHAIQRQHMGNALRESEARMAYDALHDTLTGLPNRALFMDRLEQALERQRRWPTMVTGVLFLGLDRFKDVNDAHGHVVGDDLLVAIASRLEASIGRGHTLARTGSDEFAVLVVDPGTQRLAIQVAEQLLNGLREPFEVRSHTIYAGGSVGVALGFEYRNAKDMMRDADIAMHRAKAEGGSTLAVFDPAMHRKAVARLQMETDLRKAVERREFEVYYQPIVSLEHGRLVGAEALVRWPRDGTLVGPGEFIPTAEETGLVVPLGWWVLEEACRQVGRWRDLGALPEGFYVSVNISARMIAQGDLLEKVVDLMETNHLEPGSLGIEITENVLIDHGQAVLSFLDCLKRLGVALHIDDFGTGYSALGYLRRFRYDGLKIDQSFVRGIDEDEVGSAIVETLLSLARNLDMSVVAEGVETLEQARCLHRLGCRLAQGFHFSPPVPAVDLEAMLMGQCGAPMPPDPAPEAGLLKVRG